MPLIHREQRVFILVTSFKTPVVESMYYDLWFHALLGINKRCMQCRCAKAEGKNAAHAQRTACLVIFVIRFKTPKPWKVITTLCLLAFNGTANTWFAIKYE